MENESHSAYTTRYRNLMERQRIIADARARALGRKNNTPNNQEYIQEASELTAAPLEEIGFPKADTVFEA
jgi:hypothetical protein